MNKSVFDGQNTKKAFLEKIARMYYVLEMTQMDIANQMGIGRSSVARFLSEAKKEGVVRFFITSKMDNSRSADLEDKLMKKYKLRDAIVVKENVHSLYETVVVSYLDSIIPFHGSLGIGGGTTLNNISSFLRTSEPRQDLKIVQMLGGLSKDEKKRASTSIVQNWSLALEANPIFLPALAAVENKETKEFYMKNKNIQEIYQEIRNIDISIVGIGSIQNNGVINHNLVENIDIDYLRSNSVGDINLHFFNKDGEFSMSDISDRIIGASPLDLLRIPIRVGLAKGEEKVDSIKGALNGRLINILATNAITAKLLLEEEEE